MSESDPAQAGQEKQTFPVEAPADRVGYPVVRSISSEWVSIAGVKPGTLITHIYDHQVQGVPLDEFSFPPGYTVAEAVDSAFETDFSALLAQLDASDATTGERQAVIAELRQSTETALSELGEAVAAL